MMGRTKDDGNDCAKPATRPKSEEASHLMSPEHITIAVTVFSRRQYLKQSIGSALAQSAPVRIIVLEDCGPDPGLQEFVRREFGPRVEYFRSPRNRGIFGNWNAAIERCQTPWLSILHDDDYLAPEFVAAMLELSRQVPDGGLYFGRTQIVNEKGEPVARLTKAPLNVPWRRAELAGTLEDPPFPFPGQLFRVDYAKALGGFRETSQFAGDWEMWSNLIARYGGAESSTLVAYNRSHFGPDRGCAQIDLKGTRRPLVFVQQKRVLRLMREAGAPVRFQREKFLASAPMSASELVRFGFGFAPRVLRYNVGLLLRSPPPSAPYAVFQALTRLLGVRFVRTCSVLLRALRRGP
jgi:glycosyltransferase involved in cell wall biosynthesis